MTATTEILRAGLAMQSANLALSNLKIKKKKKLVGQAFDNLIGTAMIKEQADFIGGM